MTPCIDNLEFHNVAEIVTSGNGEQRFYRFPESVRDNTFTDLGRYMSRMANGVEIRFVMQGARAELIVSSENEESELVVLRGNYLHSTHRIPANQHSKIIIENTEISKNYTEEIFSGSSFHPNVWRIYSKAHPFILHHLDDFGYGIRKPYSEEKPNTTWIAYGSSITQGGDLYNNYVNSCAQLLGMDVRNLGMAGSCHVEPTIAEFIMQSHWDLLTLELGINMCWGVEICEFEKRVRNFLDIIRPGMKEGQRVALITPFLADLHFEKVSSKGGGNLQKFEEVLVNVFGEYESTMNLQLIIGRELVPDLIGYKFDLIHPEPFACFRMATALAEKLK